MSKEMSYENFIKSVELCLGNVKLKHTETEKVFNITGVSNDGKPMLSNSELKNAVKLERLCDFEVVKD